MDKKSSHKLIVRLPQEVKQWLADETVKNASSHSSEIVRSIRERMDRERATRGEPQRDTRNAL